MRLATTLAVVVVLTALASGQVVINEINCGTVDYIEIFNNTGAAVDMSGWRVYVNQDTATPANQVATIPAGTVVPAGGYLIVRELPGAALVLPAGTVLVTTTQTWAWAAGQLGNCALDMGAPGTGVDEVVWTVSATNNLARNIGNANVSPFLGVAPHNTDFIQRMQPGGIPTDTNTGCDWTAEVAATPGAPNTSAGPVGKCPSGVGQPNWVAGTSLMFDNFDNYVYPLAMTKLPGSTTSMRFTGAASSPYILVSGPSNPGNTGTPFGIVDIGTPPFFTDITIVLNGASATPNFFDALAVTGANGQSNWTFPGFTGACGTTIGSFQGVVVSAAYPFGYQLTAATTIGLGLNTNLTLTDDASVNVGLCAPFTFYDVTYSSLFVCSNGMISFGVGNTDFTPTQAEAESGPPRIMVPWYDFSPNLGGTISIADSGTGPVVTFTNVPVFGMPAAANNFSVALDPTTGNITETIPVGGFTANSTTAPPFIAGVTKGAGNTAPSLLADISSALAPNPALVGGPLQNVFEIFATAAAWDLNGTTITYFKVGNSYTIN